MGKIIKKISIVFILVILSTFIFGCNNTSIESNNKKDSITVTDTSGREVQVPNNIKRVGTFCPLSAQIVTMISKDENIDIKITAVARGLVNHELLNKLNPTMKDAVVAGSGREVNMESLIESDTELVFIKNTMLQDENQIEKLEKSGIPYIVVDPGNMNELKEIMTQIGKALGSDEKIEKYNEFTEYVLQTAKNKEENLKDEDKIKVFYAVDEAKRVEQAKSLFYEWIDVVGLESVIKMEDIQLQENKFYITIENLMNYDPEVYIFKNPFEKEIVMANPQYSQLSAVKNNKLYVLPKAISSWGSNGSIETPLAMLWAGKTFYPDLYLDIDLNKEIKRFYKDCYNYEVSDDDIEKILSGEGIK